MLVVALGWRYFLQFKNDNISYRTLLSILIFGEGVWRKLGNEKNK